MGASVVAHGDAPPILEPSEHIFDFMELFIQNFIVFILDFAVLLGRDTGRDAFFNQGVSKPVSVIAAISKKFPGFGQLIDERRRAFVIADLSRRQMQQDRFAFAVGHGMEL